LSSEIAARVPAYEFDDTLPISEFSIYGLHWTPF